MTLLKSRLERLERELRFKEWLSVQRIFDTWTDDELEAYATTGCLPANPFNKARPLHGSLDGLDRNALMKLWEEHERSFRGRSDDELGFYVKNRYWPEQGGENK